MQHHQMLAFHVEARLGLQVLFDLTQLGDGVRARDEDHLVGLAERTPGPAARTPIRLIYQAVVLRLEFVEPVLALPGAGGVRIAGLARLRRDMVRPADPGKSLREAGRNRMRRRISMQRHHDKDLCMASLDGLRGMAKTVVDGAHKHLVQRQRVQRQQPLEIGPAERGHGGVAQGGDVCRAGLLQDQPGFADAFSRPDLVVELQLATRTTARHPQAPADQEEHGVRRVTFAVHHMAPWHGLHVQQATQVLQHRLVQAAEVATRAQDIHDALVGDRRLSHGGSLPCALVCRQSGEQPVDEFPGGCRQTVLLWRHQAATMPGHQER